MRQVQWVEVERSYLEELYTEIARLKALVESLEAGRLSRPEFEPTTRELAYQMHPC